jgi:hypothetical protein
VQTGLDIERDLVTNRHARGKYRTHTICGTTGVERSGVELKGKRRRTSRARQGQLSDCVRASGTLRGSNRWSNPSRATAVYWLATIEPSPPESAVMIAIALALMPFAFASGRMIAPARRDRALPG